MKRTLFVAAMAATWMAAGVRAQEIGVGDPAPKLEVKEFVKGDKVDGFQKGKTYVVEFWATWCGPCRMSIPHLTQLQKKNKEVTFIGVSVFEHDGADKVKDFVKEMGDKMDYRVALDDVAEGAKPNDGKMAKGWMEAASQDGIPTAFVINGEGTIAWIGHPMQLEKPLDEIVSGKWDLKVATTQYKEKMALAKKRKAIRQEIAKATKAGDNKEVVAIIDKAITDEPKFEPELASIKFAALAGKDGDPEKALDYGKQLMEGIYKENAQRLNMLAWTIVDPDAPKKANENLLKLALAAAQRADELTKSGNGAIADTLAKCYFDTGDPAKAVENQERALKQAKGLPPEEIKKMEERLEQYKKGKTKDN